MEEIKNEIIRSFGHQLRVRVCGICMENNTVLLVKHHSIGKHHTLWAPPGGGMHYKESAEETLKREFREETGLTIEPERFLCVHEFLEPPLHAIELFYLVRRTGGTVQKGLDPELHNDLQIITQVEWISQEQWNQLEPGSLHQLLRIAGSIQNLPDLTGFYKQQTP